VNPRQANTQKIAGNWTATATPRRNNLQGSRCNRSCGLLSLLLNLMDSVKCPRLSFLTVKPHLSLKPTSQIVPAFPGGPREHCIERWQGRAQKLHLALQADQGRECVQFHCGCRKGAGPETAPAKDGLGLGTWDDRCSTPKVARFDQRQERQLGAFLRPLQRLHHLTHKQPDAPSRHPHRTNRARLPVPSSLFSSRARL
jgi:hypothetical protein